jgi:hypothetical protein
MQLQAAGLWPIQPLPKFIEGVFSTYLYTGNDTGQSINNGIDVSGNGGLVWIKKRSAVQSHGLYDTARGSDYVLNSNSTSSQGSGWSPYFNFASTGFTLTTDAGYNTSGATYASWTFREQQKFFDIVTYTGNGSNPRTISHNLGSTPGCIMFKSYTDSGYGWVTWHRSLNANGAVQLQTDGAEIIDANLWGGSPTDTTFSVSSYSGQNVAGISYVAYVFAHNAGGFGLTGTDNVISCGGVTANGSGDASISLGYEPQWLLTKRTDDVGNWELRDTMRGFGAASGFGTGALLRPNTSGAEASPAGGFYLTSTGFEIGNGMPPNASYIYIAIRRGPMRVPTVGTSVYNGITRTGTGANATVTGAGFPVDLLFSGSRSAAFGTIDFDRLRGATQRLFTYATAAEAARATSLTSFAVQDGYTVGDDSTDGGVNNSGQTYIYWNFRRAPSFFDEVCYTGTGANTNFTHNLGVVPEMLITKRRSNTGPWVVYTATTGNTDYLQLYTTDAVQTNTDYYNSTTPTASVFTLGSSTSTNATAQTFVAYLFATCPGVSKVGTYTGTGAAQTINCGFTSGARFVLIKRTDSTGDWYVWDSARGIIPANDPYLALNSTATEVTGTDYVDTTAVGFDITSTAPAAINANGGTFIFLAIA